MNEAKKIFGSAGSPAGSRHRAPQGNQCQKPVSPLARRSAVKYLFEERKIHS